MSKARQTLTLRLQSSTCIQPDAKDKRQNKFYSGKDQKENMQKAAQDHLRDISQDELIAASQKEEWADICGWGAFGNKQEHLKEFMRTITNQDNSEKQKASFYTASNYEVRHPKTINTKSTRRTSSYKTISGNTESVFVCKKVIHQTTDPNESNMNVVMDVGRRNNVVTESQELQLVDVQIDEHFQPLRKRAHTLGVNAKRERILQPRHQPQHSSEHNTVIQNSNQISGKLFGVIKSIEIENSKLIKKLFKDKTIFRELTNEANYQYHHQQYHPQAQLVKQNIRPSLKSQTSIPRPKSSSVCQRVSSKQKQNIILKQKTEEAVNRIFAMNKATTLFGKESILQMGLKGIPGNSKTDLRSIQRENLVESGNGILSYNSKNPFSKQMFRNKMNRQLFLKS